MRASSESTALVPVDPRRRIVCSVRESLVALHGALIIAEQQTYERVSGPVPSIEVLIELLQKDPWFTWLHPIADLLVRMDHLLRMIPVTSPMRTSPISCERLMRCFIHPWKGKALNEPIMKRWIGPPTSCSHTFA